MKFWGNCEYIQLTEGQKKFFRDFYSQNTIFSLFSMQNHRFSNRQNGVRVSKKSTFSQNRFYTFLLYSGHPWTRCDPQKNGLGTTKWCFDHFLTPVRGILTQKTAILTYFRCFLMILQDLNYWAACRGRVGVHKNRKKSKSPKISLNTPKVV